MIYHTKGKLYLYRMFSGRCDFVDHVSGYMSIKYQVAINATETINTKLNLEREAKIQGVTNNGYHIENGVFNDSEFIEDIFKKKKNITFTDGWNLT